MYAGRKDPKPQNDNDGLADSTYALLRIAYLTFQLPMRLKVRPGILEINTNQVLTVFKVR